MFLMQGVIFLMQGGNDSENGSTNASANSCGTSYMGGDADEVRHSCRTSGLW